MRRALRHAFTLLSALSLLLCVAVCALWLRSYWRADSFTRWYAVSERHVSFFYTLRTFRRIDVIQSGGWVYIKHANPAPLAIGAHFEKPNMQWQYTSGLDVERITHSTATRYAFCSAVTPAAITFAGNGHAYDARIGQREIFARHWVAALLASIAPTCWMIPRARARIRRTKGRCENCGYDLRASPRRCPECGRAAGARLARSGQFTV